MCICQNCHSYQLFQILFREPGISVSLLLKLISCSFCYHGNFGWHEATISWRCNITFADQARISAAAGPSTKQLHNWATNASQLSETVTTHYTDKTPPNAVSVQLQLRLVKWLT